MSLEEQDLDDLYTELCNGMTGQGEARIPLILARLALLLMNEVGDAARVRAAIREALDLAPEDAQSSIGSSTKSL